MGDKQDVLWEVCKWRIRESAQTFRARRILKLAFQDFPDMGMRISTIYTSKSCNVIISISKIHLVVYYQCCVLIG